MSEANCNDSTTTLIDLPPELLLRILHRLPTPEAIRTALVTRKWRDLWTSLPYLSFDQTFFPFITLQSFFHFINRTLILRSHSHLSSLRLNLPTLPDLRFYKYHIDSYVRYAVAHNANQLILTFYTKHYVPREEAVYDFPFAILKNSSVSCLFLDRCNLTLSRTTQFETLNRVTLKHVCLSDEMLSDLVTGCVNLEFLELRCCYELTDIKIFSSKLRELLLGNFICHEGSVEISASNLCTLNIYFFEVGSFVMEKTSALVEANVWHFQRPESFGPWSQIFRSIGNVKKLCVQNWGYQAMAAMDLCSKSFSFYNLNHMDLQTEFTKSDILGMAALLQRSPLLETLTLDSSFKRDDETSEISEAFSKINFSLPSLRQLTVKCYLGMENDLCFLKLVLRNQVVLERIVLYTYPMYVECKLVPPIIMVKRPQGFQVIQGSFPHL